MSAIIPAYLERSARGSSGPAARLTLNPGVRRLSPPHRVSCAPPGATEHGGALSLSLRAGPWADRIPYRDVAARSRSDR